MSATAASRCLGLFDLIANRQRFGGDERGLQRVEGRGAGRHDIVGKANRFVERPAFQRQPRAQHAHGPFVPLTGLAAVPPYESLASPRKSLA